MSSIIEIREKIFEKAEAQRLVIRVHTDKLDSCDYRVSAGNFVNEIFPNWEDDSRVRFLAIEIRGDRRFMSIDVNNFGYDFDTAHETKTTLPVYILWLHERKGWFLVRWPQEDGPLATKLAELHGLNGYDAVTPFFCKFQCTGRLRQPPESFYESIVLSEQYDMSEHLELWRMDTSAVWADEQQRTVGCFFFSFQKFSTYSYGSFNTDINLPFQGKKRQSSTADLFVFYKSTKYS